MGRQRAVEIGVGAFMAVGLVALFFLAMQVSNLSAAASSDGYRVQARFKNVGSLKARAPVSLGGVRIGRVEAIALDTESFDAVVTLRIESKYNRIPDDTFANIYTAGLLGEQYVGLDPGGSDKNLGEGGEIRHEPTRALVDGQ